MKRIIVTTIIFLLAGAVVNVAVAWGWAASAERPGLTQSDAYRQAEGLGWQVQVTSNTTAPHKLK